MRLPYRRTRCDSEFLAKRPPHAVVDAHGLADISLYGEGVHQQAVTTFAQRRAVDQAPCGPFGPGQLGPADAESGGCECLQRMVEHIIEPPTPLVDPRGLVLR